MQEEQLVTKFKDHIARNFGQVRLFPIQTILGELKDVINSLRQNNAKLGQLRPYAP
jgi:hypothetical protein